VEFDLLESKDDADRPSRSAAKMHEEYLARLKLGDIQVEINKKVSVHPDLVNSKNIEEPGEYYFDSVIDVFSKSILSLPQMIQPVTTESKEKKPK